jgi:hypothetical protein
MEYTNAPIEGVFAKLNIAHLLNMANNPHTK